MNSDLQELLACLNQHRVKYLIVGGYAVMKYSEPRYTKDVDLLVEATKANSRKLVAALRKFGAPLDNVAEDEFSKVGTMYFMGIAPNRVDILTRIKGVAFRQAYNAAEKGKLFDVAVKFISRKDLIKAKRAAGRPQDILDLAKLKE